MLVIYNSLTKRKQPFEPIEPGKVRMYVCGMTVYDYCHLGHARVLTVFDMVVRYLRTRGYDVTYVRNITDIDDKIIKRAAENNKTVTELTDYFIKAMHKDAADLGLAHPDVEPRATQSIANIVRMIEILVDKGYAYRSENRDVYYDVSRFMDYGKLSGKDPKDLRAGTRVEINEAKDDPLDFVLWKAAKPGEPRWDSPWGPGRPGWHIECSAMAVDSLGEHFDIHGGGMDLQFPHHENEIAQSEAATGEPFVNYWMHNGFVRVNEEKMSKSLDNFFTVREVLKQYRPEEIRLFILNSHYRSPLNYSDEQLDNARAALTRFYIALRNLPDAQSAKGGDYQRHFHAAMDDDFNTPEAVAVLFDLARDINKAREQGNMSEAAPLAALLKKLGCNLGLLQDDPDQFFKQVTALQPATREIKVGLSAVIRREIISDEQIEELITQRAKARENKNWSEADRIRDELQACGIVLEDTAGGTFWRRE